MKEDKTTVKKVKKKRKGKMKKLRDDIKEIREEGKEEANKKFIEFANRNWSDEDFEKE